MKMKAGDYGLLRKSIKIIILFVEWEGITTPKSMKIKEIHNTSSYVYRQWAYTGDVHGPQIRLQNKTYIVLIVTFIMKQDLFVKKVGLIKNEPFYVFSPTLCVSRANCLVNRTQLLTLKHATKHLPGGFALPKHLFKLVRMLLIKAVFCWWSFTTSVRLSSQGSLEHSHCSML